MGSVGALAWLFNGTVLSLQVWYPNIYNTVAECWDGAGSWQNHPENRISWAQVQSNTRTKCQARTMSTEGRQGCAAEFWLKDDSVDNACAKINEITTIKITHTKTKCNNCDTTNTATKSWKWEKLKGKVSGVCRCSNNFSKNFLYCFCDLLFYLNLTPCKLLKASIIRRTVSVSECTFPIKDAKSKVAVGRVVLMRVAGSGKEELGLMAKKYFHCSVLVSQLTWRILWKCPCQCPFNQREAGTLMLQHQTGWATGGEEALMPRNLLCKIKHNYLDYEPVV